jgi:hypothetical protein
MENIKKNTNFKTWILLLPLIFVYTYLGLGILLVWGDSLPQSTREWLLMLGSSILYLITGVIGFIFSCLFTLYKLVHENILIVAIKKHWPILIALIYPFLPNLPGPIDEVVVGTILSSLATYFGWKNKKQEALAPKESSF